MKFGIKKNDDGTFEWGYYEKSELSSATDNLYFPLSAPHIKKTKIRESDIQIGLMESFSDQLLHSYLKKIHEMKENNEKITIEAIQELFKGDENAWFTPNFDTFTPESDWEYLSNFKFYDKLPFHIEGKDNSIPLYIFLCIINDEEEGEISTALFVIDPQNKDSS